MGKTYIKVEAESRQNKLGQMTKWQDMEPSTEKREDEPGEARRERILREQYPRGKHETDEKYETRLKQYRKQPREYWSEDSIRERSLEEQYPQIEQESDEEYQTRLELIGEALLSAVKPETYTSGGKEYYIDYTTTETAGKSGERIVYHGHRFEELEPDIEDLSRGYEELFGESKKERIGRTLEDALADSEEARRNPNFPTKVETPKIYESQSKLARHYVGALNRSERAFVKKGIFEGFGESRYLPRDAAHLARVKEDIDLSEKQQEMLAFPTDAKILEGLFYPLVLQGFFDSSPDRKKHAAIIVPSEFDDVVGKVDAAVLLPIVYTNGKGEKKIIRMPICFDLTTGTGDGKVNNIADDFHNRHGYADIRYPSSCTGRKIEPLEDVPHFAISVDRLAFGKMKEQIAGGGISFELQALINYQMQQQALQAQAYWERRKGGENKAGQMAFLANYFGYRLEGSLKASRMSVRELRERYRESFRYLDQL